MIGCDSRKIIKKRRAVGIGVAGPAVEHHPLAELADASAGFTAMQSPVERAPFAVDGILDEDPSCVLEKPLHDRVLARIGLAEVQASFQCNL